MRTTVPRGTRLGRFARSRACGQRRRVWHSRGRECRTVDRSRHEVSMRAARFASLLAVSLAVLPACDDSNTPATPLSVEWLEWSDSGVAGAPFGGGVRGSGAPGSDLRIT